MMSSLCSQLDPPFELLTHSTQSAYLASIEGIPKVLRVSSIVTVMFVLAPQIAGSQEANSYCASPMNQSSCPASCASFCAEEDFFRNNFGFCSSIGVSGGTVGTVSADVLDANSCRAVFEPEVTAVAPETAGPSEECGALPTRYQQIQCEAAQNTPNCASTPFELEGRADLLFGQIDEQLSQYGNLLTQDWTDVRNRSLLCVFSADDLEKNYNVAASDPATLQTLSRNAQDIQDCSNDWEAYTSDPALITNGAMISDEVQQSLIMEFRDRLQPLGVQIRDLEDSIRTLENATTAIESVMLLHGQWCAPEGTPLQQ